ncbi:hypothetical protein STAL104432_30425 [Streptomyces albus]
MDARARPFPCQPCHVRPQGGGPGVPVHDDDHGPLDQPPGGPGTGAARPGGHAVHRPGTRTGRTRRPARGPRNSRRAFAGPGAGR